MRFPFSVAWRDEIAPRCAAFPRIAYGGGDPLKHAAVTLAVSAADDGSGGAAILLTRRAASLRNHGGQWALPGGRCDPGETIVEAALREMREELGLSVPANDVLGLLDDYPTRSGYAIAPVVVWVGDVSAMVPNPDEVASVHTVRLDQLAADDAVEFLIIPESERQVLRLHYGERNIHAPTAAMMYQMRELALGRVTRVAQYDAPVFAWK